MATVNEVNSKSGDGILTAQALVDWKREKGLLKVPVLPSKVIISPQMGIVKARRSFRGKEIKGLAGMHVCVNAAEGVYLSGGWGIGASALVAVCEELRILGAKEFYLTGLCGRLTNDIGEGEVVVAASAIREEGTSQHYLPAGAGEEIACPFPVGQRGLSVCLPAKTARFVSTDAPYRETKEKYAAWRAQHAEMIDMETAALFAFGDFYELLVTSTAIGADSLADGKWTMASDYGMVHKKLSGVVDQIIDLITR